MTISEHIGVIPEWTAADRLVKARQHARLTQSQLAVRLGISAKSIKRYEAGAAPKRAVLLGWAMTCGVSPHWLETGNDGDGGGDAPTRAHNLGYTCTVDRLPARHLVAA